MSVLESSVLLYQLQNIFAEQVCCDSSLQPSFWNLVHFKINNAEPVVYQMGTGFALFIHGLRNENIKTVPFQCPIIGKEN